MDVSGPAIEKARIRQNAMEDNLKRLKAAGIPCEIKENAILGAYKGEPFCVYLQWVHATKEKFAGVVCTRYKGTDNYTEEPVEVLKQ